MLSVQNGAQHPSLPFCRIEKCVFFDVSTPTVILERSEESESEMKTTRMSVAECGQALFISKL